MKIIRYKSTFVLAILCVIAPSVLLSSCSSESKKLPFDGVSFAPAFKTDSNLSPEKLASTKPLYFYYPHYGKPGDEPSFMIVKNG